MEETMSTSHNVNTPVDLPSTIDINNLHHLMRVRVHKSLFSRLQDIATEETSGTGEYTSVSDLVRSAIRSWIQTYETAERLRSMDVTPSSTRPRLR
jgi:Arc/MetJ-type ribon-helix-helix transcriptional regulator